MPNKNTSIFRNIVVAILISFLIFGSLYVTLVQFLLNISNPVEGVIAPLLVSIIMGSIGGFYYTQRKTKQLSLEHALEQQKILKEISLLSQMDYNLINLLNKSIHLILGTSFTNFQPEIGILLVNSSNKLVLKSYVNLSPNNIARFKGEEETKDQYHCKLALAEKRTLFKQILNNNNTSKYKDYNKRYYIPILFNNTRLGVIAVFLDKSHAYNQPKIDFFEAVASVLALIINSHYSNKKSKKKEAVLREVQKLSGIGIWTKNIRTDSISASEEVFNILGYELNKVQLSQDFLSERVHPLDRVSFNKAVVDAKKGISTELEFRHLKKDGSLIYVINKWTPTVRSNGQVEEISGALIDITKLRTNEAELVEKQQLVNGILSATPDPLYLLDLDTSEFLYCNIIMANVLKNNSIFTSNYKTKGVGYFRELVHKDDLAAYDKMNWTLRKRVDVFTLKFRTKAFNNTYRWIEQKVTVYERKNNGHVCKVLIVSKDINEKIHVENRVKTLNVELAAQNRDIKKINSELDQFVYSVSHDLRAPLASMLGLVNLSKLDSAKPKELVGYMDKIGKSVERLDGFIKDILDYSKNSRTEVESKPIVLEHVFMEIINAIKTIYNPDIKLILETDEPVVFNGDIIRIKIILNNIISNVIKYADYNKPSRFLKVQIKTSTNGCNIVIEDNGIGINQDSLSKIFTMFYRGTETSKGSGIGLYIVQEAINKLKGTINIDSTLGKGTVVCINIPHTKY